MTKVILSRPLTLLGCMLLLGSALAQEPLTLQTALERTLERNYDIRIERRNTEEAINNNSWGEAGRYPNISLSLNQNNAITDNVETATPFQIQDVVQSRSINPVVQLNWTLFSGFKANISRKRLEALEEQSMGNASVVIANTIQSVILGYYTAVLEKERLQEFEKQLSLSRDKFKYIAIKREIGGAATADLLLEEGNYLTDSINYINQQLAFRSAVRNLNVLLAEEPGKDYELIDALAVDVIEYSFDNLANRLDDGNIDLRKQYIAQKVLQYDLELSKADRWPTLSMNSSFNNNRNRLDLSGASFPSQATDGTLNFIPGPPDPLNSITNTTALNFVVSFNLFNGGKINRAIQNAIIREDIGNLEIDKLRNSLQKDLAQAFDQYIVRRQIHGINRRKREAAEMNLQLSEDTFKGGTINSFDYRTVQNTHLVAAMQELQSVYDLVDSKVSLLRLTGGLLEDYNNNE